MLAAKHFDPILGIDIHLLALPPGTPIPIPHPHIGIIFDVLDYLPIFGGTVKVNGVPRATAGTAGKPIPHIPMGGPFVMPPGNEDEIFMGGATVVADGAPFSFTALPVLSCQSVGMLAPIRAKKPKKSYGMVLPTTTVLPIPIGAPVMIGGPPTIDAMGVATTAGLAGLGAAFKKMRKMQKSSKRVKKISDAIHKKADKLMDKLGAPPSVRNRVHKGVCAVTGHPVDVASGKVFTDWIDFQLPGPIPLSWERTWFSSSTYQGSLGHGWHHNYDWKLIEEDGAVAVMMQDGRHMAFPALKEGEESFNRQERMTLHRDDQGYRLKHVDGNWLRFTPAAASGYPQATVTHYLSAITDATENACIQFHYTAGGCLSRIIDSGGRRIQFESDADNRIRRILLPHPDNAGEFYCAIEYDYYGGDLVATRDALGSEFSYQYQNHLLCQETGYNGLSFYFKYDGADHNARCIHTWGDGGIYNHQLVYDDEKSLTIVQNSLGYQTVYHHDGALPHRIETASGGVIVNEYNEYYQVTCETNELGLSTRYEYDSRGNLTQITQADGSTLQMEYDERDNAVKAQDANGGAWLWEYDEHCRLTAKVDPLDRRTRYSYEGAMLTSVAGSAGQETHIEYDGYNNPIGFATPDGGSPEWRYDNHGRITLAIDAQGVQRRLQYDLLGRVTQVNEPDGNLRTFSYDPEGNLVRATDAQFDVHFTYQGMGRIASRTQAGTTIQFEYDTEEQLTAITNEHGDVYRFELGPTGETLSESGFDGLLRRYERNAAGQVRRILKPGGRHTDYAYDTLGRVMRILHSDGEEERFQYRPDGELMLAVNSSATLSFERNALGQVTKEICGDLWVSSEYDALGLRSRMRSSLGADQQIQRNAAGDVMGVTTGDALFSAQFKRDELGRELERSLPGGVRSRWRRDRLGRPSQHEVLKADASQSAKTYFWGVNGRLEKMHDSLNGVSVFEHDELGNLVSARYGDGVMDLRMPDAIGALFQSYNRKDREYGPAGQLLSMRRPNGLVRFEYDAEGNLITKSEPGGKIWRYEWNVSGTLKKVIRPDGRIVTFEYDALGRRLRKTFNGRITRWVWDGNNPLHEWVEMQDAQEARTAFDLSSVPTETVSGRPAIARSPIQPQAPPAAISPQARPVAAGGESKLITWLFEPESFTPMAKQVGDAYFSILADYLGTPNAMYDSEGRQVWSADISVWGELRNLKGDRRACPFRWPGQYEDEETGLYYNRFRYYDPDSGQYIRQDPIKLRGGLNLYAYTPDPLTWIDPFGLSCEKGKELDEYRRQNRIGFDENGVYRGVLPQSNNHFFERLTKDDVYDFDMPGRRSGHGQSKHGVNIKDRKVLDILNDPERIFTGKNKNGNYIDIYFKDGNAVFTDAGNKRSIITVYGKIDPRQKKPVKDDQWADPLYERIVDDKKQVVGWKEGEYYAEINQEERHIREHARGKPFDWD
ncbi:DUF6531 domain-containing protein [Hahella aquimaris]|uniref:DUF6531 domain-containing protein n=1 Tax=Hahella sp. HNIBRBA332 TaxID=3015983 RepID=UPI00273B2776|nr:DUF6531 domain-containing protein [Hahella sp. HNIBRBA332]WLQ16197.1 DUF6531 domain-containing protein [Hahella sp. HNIBRBA332]